jgi:hypothetical protein
MSEEDKVDGIDEKETNEEMHPENYWKCDDEIVEIAEEMIKLYHPDAAYSNICYLFRAEHSNTGGKIILGTCTKQSDKLKILHGFDFIIEFAYDVWEQLTDIQQKALILHELKHIEITEGKEGQIKLRLCKHDLEEFRDVVEIFGLYTQDLQQMASVIAEAKEKE